MENLSPSLHIFFIAYNVYIHDLKMNLSANKHYECPHNDHRTNGALF